MCAQVRKAVVLSSKTSYKGKVFSVTTDKVTEPGGVTSTRDVIRHNGSVVVFAVDASTNPADPSVVVIRQYRHAAGQFLLELPAGRIEPGRSTAWPRPNANSWKRPACKCEESGRSSQPTMPAPASSPRPCRSTSPKASHWASPRPKRMKRSNYSIRPLSHLTLMVKSGKIKDGKTIIGILKLSAAHFLSNET